MGTATDCITSMTGGGGMTTGHPEGSGIAARGPEGSSTKAGGRKCP